MAIAGRLTAALGRGVSMLVLLALAATVATFALQVTGADHVVVFVASAVALAALAALVGEGTEQLGHRFGAGATGVLQSALGNLPELFISISPPDGAPNPTPSKSACPNAATSKISTSKSSPRT